MLGIVYPCECKITAQKLNSEGSRRIGNLSIFAPAVSQYDFSDICLVCLIRSEQAFRAFEERLTSFCHARLPWVLKRRIVCHKLNSRKWAAFNWSELHKAVAVNEWRRVGFLRRLTLGVLIVVLFVQPVVHRFFECPLTQGCGAVQRILCGNYSRSPGVLSPYCKFSM